MDKFAEKVGAWLLKEGNTKTRLANALGVSVGTLNNRLSGDCEWTWSEVCALSDILECPLSDFRAVA